MIPKYGFPVDVVELDTQSLGTSESSEILLQRDLIVIGDVLLGQLYGMILVENKVSHKPRNFLDRETIGKLLGLLPLEARIFYMVKFWCALRHVRGVWFFVAHEWYRV